MTVRIRYDAQGYSQKFEVLGTSYWARYYGLQAVIMFNEHSSGRPAGVLMELTATTKQALKRKIKEALIIVGVKFSTEVRKKKKHKLAIEQALKGDINE